ncbi:MAG: glutamine-hydrolyzing GMP synthase [Bifidobacteriaceae bacterium]|jgi:GMP synthase (glutamine-hydrolysing)|nr:glutamine-hydrolyzing GMP synthase [Bifidobacteriaceae bacterium]
MRPVLIIDFGAQYTQLIARRIRELGVYSEIVRYDVSLEQIQKIDPAALILTGGPANVLDFDAPNFDERILHLGIPTLGLCYGFQKIAQVFGGTVANLSDGEFGKTLITTNGSTLIPTGRTINNNEILGEAAGGSNADGNPTQLIPNSQFLPVNRKAVVWMSHRVSVTKAPAGFKCTASSELVPVEAIENDDLKIYGVQFHPEVKHTEAGIEVFRNFLFKKAKLQADWTPANIIEQKLKDIRAQIGPENKAICGLSGGVDSAVAAALVNRAIGDRLICIFVDHGLLRSGEREQVEQDFAQALNLNLITTNSEEVFLSALKEIEDPECKRKIIGEKFIREFERVVRSDLANRPIKYLVQGTLYPDVVESGGVGDNIKSHHNVGGLPQDLQFKLVEPLRDLFKDEVRNIGRELGVPESIVNRQPFPGPGLAIRIIGDVDKTKLKILRKADSIVRSILTEAGFDDRIWQCPIVLLSKVRSVGVQGDGRTYGYPLVIRPVDSEDAMTADFSELPHQLLSKIATQVTNQVPEINRVVLDITSKPPGTIEWE